MNASLLPPIIPLDLPPRAIAGADEPPSHRHRTIWISDIHLGTRVVYVPGNHDEFARAYVDHAFGGIEVMHEVVHRTADGKRLLVTHGDLFDGVVQRARWLAMLGDTLYSLILSLNHDFNRLRARLGFGYWSLSQYLKHRAKGAVSFITDFELALAREARRRGFDGVVCGHIHKAEIRMVDGMLYCNDGDWVESLTALVEDDAGVLRIVEWNTIRADAALPAPAMTAPPLPTRPVPAAEAT